MSKQRHAPRIAGLLLIAVAAQTWMVGRNSIPAQDAVAFLQYARQFEHSSIAEVLERNPQHPLYPLLVWCEHRVLEWLGVEVDWIRSAQIAAAAAAVLCIIPMYLAGCRLGNPSVATGATGLFTLLPFTMRLGADAMADSTHLLFLLIAFWGCTEFLTGRRKHWLLSSGLGVGLAYLARPEALLLPAGLLPTLAVVQAKRSWRMPWRTLIGGAALMLLGATCSAGPYMLLTGKLTPKGSVILLPGGDRLAGERADRDESVEQVRTFSDGQSIARPYINMALPASPETGLSFDVRHRRPDERFTGYWPALVELARELTEGLHYVFGLLVLFGLIRAGRGPANLFASLLAGVFAVVLIEFASNAGYVASRHVLVLVCLGCYVAARGGLQLAERLAGLIGWFLSRAGAMSVGGVAGSLATFRRWTWGLLLILAGTFCLPRSWDALHSSRVAHEQAGRWLAAHAAPDSVVLDSRGWAALYAGLRAYDYHGARLAFEDPRLTYVVVERTEVEDERPRAETLRRLLAVAGQKLAEFDTPGVVDSVQVYRWFPERLAANPLTPAIPSAN